jgi:hypothetical protein
MSFQQIVPLPPLESQAIDRVAIVPRKRDRDVTPPATHHRCSYRVIALSSLRTELSAVIRKLGTAAETGPENEMYGHRKLCEQQARDREAPRELFICARRSDGTVPRRYELAT